MPAERIILVESGLATRAIQVETDTGTATRVEGVESGPHRLIQLVEAGFPAELLYFVSGGPMSVAIKTYADLTGFNDNIAFTVTGVVEILQIFGVVGDAITSTSGTTTMSVEAVVAGAFFGPTTVDGSNLIAGGIWTSGAQEGTAPSAEGRTASVFLNGDDIQLVRSVDDITAGSLILYVIWEAVSTGATVVAT